MKVILWNYIVIMPLQVHVCYIYLGSDDEEDSVKTFDIEEARMIRSYDKLGQNPTKVK